MNGKKISVVIPYYNVDVKLFEYCIDSLKKQDYEDFDIIVVDDGSKDIFSKIIDEKYKDDEQIVIYRTKNNGVSEARNYAMNITDAKYICFVDADDYVSPQLLSSLYKIACTTGADIVTSYIRPVYDDEFGFRKLDRNLNYRELDKNEAKEIIIKGFSDNMSSLGFVSGGPCSLLIERQLAVDVGFPKGIPYMEDVIWNYKVFTKSRKSVLLNETMYAYRQNSNSATHAWKLSIIDKRIEALNIIKQMLAGEYDEVFGLRCLSSYSIICKACMKTDEIPSVLGKLRKARTCLKNPIWEFFKDKNITKNWGKKYKIKRFLAITGLMPYIYLFKN